MLEVPVERAYLLLGQTTELSAALDQKFYGYVMTLKKKKKWSNKEGFIDVWC